jgi:hypothetical protein
MNQGPDDLTEQALGGVKIQRIGVAEDPAHQVGADEDFVASTHKDNTDRGTLFFVEQFNSLRDEIGRRIDIRQQIMALNLIIAGTLFTLGVQPGIPETILLFYPLLAMFLAALWAHNDLRIGQINYYIRTVIEQNVHSIEPGWEGFRRQAFLPRRQRKSQKQQGHPLDPPSGLIAFSTRGIFLSTQVLSQVIVGARFVVDVLQKRLIIDLSNTHWTDLQHIGGMIMPILILLNVGIIGYTGLLLRHQRV